MPRSRALPGRRLGALGASPVFPKRTTSYCRPGTPARSSRRRSVRLLEPFTDDRGKLDQALDRIEKIAPSASGLDSERESALQGVEQAYMGYFGNGGDPEVACQLSAGWGAMENAARTYAAAVQAHVRASASAVATGAQSLTGLPGHRVLVYVGGGMPQTAGIEIFQLIGDVCPSRQSELSTFQLDYDLTWLYQEVADRANAAGVTLYALEASNPAVDLGFDSRLSGGAVSTGSRSTRGQLAGATHGGRVGYGPSFRPSVVAQRQRSLDDEGSLVGGEQLVEVDLEVSAGRNHVALAVRDGLGGEVSYLRREFWVPPEKVAAVQRQE